MTDYADVGAFAIPFAYALTALRKAADNGEPLTLTAEEAKALLEGIRLLRVKES